MGLIEIFLIGIGLAMDAFAVSICKGLNMRKFNLKQAGIIALFFGGFQAFMPFLGWALGKQFEKYITSVDHWIAFFLLSIIGGKMIYESLKKDDGDEGEDEDLDRFSLKNILILSVATSIDALAVGITFAFLNVNIVEPIFIIGVVTLLISFIGVVIGNKFGSKIGGKSELLGGIILCLIGIKILFEHLGFISW